jgi:2-oxoisovalerate dehydrogenase E1 component alpha subunit
MNLERILDNRMLTLQRQGRIEFYGPSIGQDADIVAASMAMEPDDWIVQQYREPGATLVQGMPLRDMTCQLVRNTDDPAKGPQMPCHDVFRQGNGLSVSLSVGTHIPYAMGITRAMKLRRTRTAVLLHFGDGAISTPDFHIPMNFAAVFNVPCVVSSNNDQWAISLPVERQTATTTLAEKVRACGLRGLRLDGIAALALHGAIRLAGFTTRAENGPRIIETLAYRFGPHSSSDDPSRYRDERRLLHGEPTIRSISFERTWNGRVGGMRKRRRPWRR